MKPDPDGAQPADETVDEPLAELLDAMRRGAAAPEAVAQLERQLAEDRALRRRVLHWAHFEACLAWELTELAPAGPLLDRAGDALPDAAPEPDSAMPLSTPLRGSGLLRSPQFLSLLAAGLFTFAVLVTLAVIHMPSFAPSPTSTDRPQRVARLSGTRDAQWRLADEQAPPVYFREGEPWELISGTAEITLLRGATTLLEGPVRLAVQDSNTLQLDYGAAFCEVPPDATGFRVITPSVEIVDLGTSFGVEVAADGATDICMFAGVAQAYPRAAAPDAAPIALRSGAAVRFVTEHPQMLASRAAPERFTTRIERRAASRQRIAAQQGVFRLGDSDGDGSGDHVRGPMMREVAVGELNAPEPAANVGRVWITFALTESERQQLQRAEQVQLVLSASQVRNRELVVAVEGLPLSNTAPPQPGDYQRGGEFLGRVTADQLARAKGWLTLDVTGFVRRQAAAGGQPFAVRLQIESPSLPDADARRDNILFVTVDRRGQGPALVATIPRRPLPTRAND